MSILSNRKRRMYLCYPLPQNLSSRSLSLKDKNWLKKTIGYKSFSYRKNFIKQQKRLYEKHILQYLFIEKSLQPCIPKNTNTQFGFCVWKNRNYESLYIYKDFREQNLAIKPQNTLLSSITPYPVFASRNNLSIYLQTIKTQKKESYTFEKKYQKCPSPTHDKYSVFFQNKKAIMLAKKNEMLKYLLCPKTSVIKEVLSNKQRKQIFPLSKLFDICKSYISPHLKVNGTNKHFYVRYLYRREHIINTCKNPQNKIFESSNKAKYLSERRKISLFYGGLKPKDISIVFFKAKLLTGKIEDNILSLLESRVDVCVFRAGLSKTVAMARQLIRSGLVYKNGKPLYSAKAIAEPGDVFYIKPYFETLSQSYKHITLSLYKSYREKVLEGLYISKKKKEKNHTLSLFNKNQRKIKEGYFSYGFYLYRFLCKKHIFYLYNKNFIQQSMYRTENSTLELGHWPKGRKNLLDHKSRIQSPQHWTKSLGLKKDNQQTAKDDRTFPFFLCKKNNIFYRKVFFNVYVAFCQKYFLSKRKYFLGLKNFENIFEYVQKNTENPYNSTKWPKPLHLEISQKTTTFIYLYKPQKVISPILFDFSVYKSFRKQKI